MNGRSAVGDLEHEPRVDEAMALDESILLLALAGRPIALVLAGSRLTDPARSAEAGHVVQGAR
jgi:hypothetical protein